MRKDFFCVLFILLPATCLFAQRTGYADVEKIFQVKCGTCHRPGEAAPFPLLTYEDIGKRAAFIKKVIQDDYMPPWKADVHYRDFSNNRSLTSEEREKILHWIDEGVPKGLSAGVNSSVLPTTAYHRPPDLVLKIDSSFLVPGDDAERFIVFKLPYELKESRNIEAIEFFCNNKKIIHHANYGFYDVPDSAVSIYGGSKYIDGDNPGPALNEYDPLKRNFTYYTGWIPGASYESYPQGIGWTLPKRGVLLLTVHYTALGADENSLIGVNLFFTPKAIKRPVKVISLGSGGIGQESIEPPLTIFAGHVDSFHLKVRTQEDQSLLYIWPHMHYIGKEFRAFAVTPAGDTIPLIHIPRWDFRWQELYRVKNLIKIPAGSVVNMVGVYDNTADNPANPSSPPRLVLSTGNMNARDEMLTLILIYVASEENDEKVSLE